MSTLDIRLITAEQTHPLRSLVLRPGKALSACSWPGDDNRDSFHAGAFLNGALVAIASVVPESIPDLVETADDCSGSYRLRGMATHPDFRGRGMGAALLAFCIEQTRAIGGRLLWCNARAPAVAFYQRAGFQTLGEEFEVAEIGPHVRMRLVLPGGPVPRSHT